MMNEYKTLILLQRLALLKSHFSLIHSLPSLSAYRRLGSLWCVIVLYQPFTRRRISILYPQVFII